MKLATDKWLSDPLPQWAFSLTALAIPLHQRIAPLCIGIMLLAWLMSGKWENKWKHLKEHYYFIFPAGYYLVHLLGMAYSEDTLTGWRDIETKASLLFLPVMIISSGPLSTGVMQRIFRAFILGLLLAALYGIGQAAWHFFYEWYQVQTGALSGQFYAAEFFFAARLSPFIHPGYFSLYLCLGLYIILASLKYSQIMGSRKFLVYGTIVFFILFVFLLAARIGIITLSLILCWFFFQQFRDAVKKWKPILVFTVLVLFAVILFSASENLRHRLVQTAEELFAPRSVPDQRTRIRNVAWESVKENLPLGTGTGDVKSTLMAAYAKAGYSDLLDKKLNAHNQYLQSFLALGFPGILLLLLLICCPLCYSRHPLTLLVCFSWAFFMFFESVFEIQAGVIFLSFFLPVLSCSLNNGKKNLLFEGLLGNPGENFQPDQITASGC